MQNCGIKVEHKSIIEQIKEELKPTSYAECGNCGAIKVDAKELARAINLDIWNKWESENEHRLCSFMDGYEGNVYIAYSEVILYVDENCKCFKDKLGVNK